MTPRGMYDQQVVPRTDDTLVRPNGYTMSKTVEQRTGLSLDAHSREVPPPKVLDACKLPESVPASDPPPGPPWLVSLLQVIRSNASGRMCCLSREYVIEHGRDRVAVEVVALRNKPLVTVSQLYRLAHCSASMTFSSNSRDAPLAGS
jgi:hypothetical protein